MKMFRNFILLSIVTICGVNYVDGMESGHKHARDGSGGTEQRKAGKTKKIRPSAVICLKSNIDGTEVFVDQEIAGITSVVLKNMISSCDVSERFVFPLAFSGSALRELVSQMTEQANLLQKGMALKYIIDEQKKGALLDSGEPMRCLADFLGCGISCRVLGDEKQETLYDYFVSGIVPLRLIGMSPETLDLATLFEQLSKPRSVQRVAMKALNDPDLCKFYPKLPNGELKTEINTLLTHAALVYIGNFAVMPVRLAVTVCLLDLPFKGQILRAFGIREQYFDEHILSAVDSRCMEMTGFRDMNALKMSFIIECARQLQVTCLNLCFCQLTALPTEIWQLKALTKLRVNNNPLLIALPAEIGQLEALTYLGLRDNGLTVLPAEIGQLKALMDLDISGNKLAGLPDEIGQHNKKELVVYVEGNPFAVRKNSIIFPGHPGE